MRTSFRRKAGRVIQTYGTRAEAVCALVTARVLVRYGLRLISGWAFGEGKAAGLRPSAELSRRIAGATEEAARLLVGETVCLPRALAAKWMLERRGCAATIRLGVGQDGSGGPLHAHAWLEAGGRIVVGQGGRESVTELPLSSAAAMTRGAGR